MASLSSFANENPGARLKKVGLIVEVFSQFRPATCDGRVDILDVGTGTGVIGQAVEAALKGRCIHMDVDDRFAIRHLPFVVASGQYLPFRDQTFTFLVANHVIEHMDNQGWFLGEIRRVLKEGGLCYLATPSKYGILEPHYKVPFLSWLPPRWADLAVRLTQRGRGFDVRPLSRHQISQLAAQAGLEATELTLHIVLFPRRYRRKGLTARLGSLLPKRLVALLLPLAPTQVWALQATGELLPQERATRDGLSRAGGYGRHRNDS